jgi:hypothetical protein
MALRDFSVIYPPGVREYGAPRESLRRHATTEQRKDKTKVKLGAKNRLDHEFRI